MNKIIFCFLTILFLIGLDASITLACSCSVSKNKTETQLINDALTDSNAVFSGKVIKIIELKTPAGKPSGSVEVKFEAQKSWKGVTTDKISVFTTKIGWHCGYPFKTGKRYLVYANQVAERNNQSWTDLCTRTTKLS